MAKLGLADLLTGGPKSPADLARSVGADPRTLHRVLRALAGVGVFAERKDGRFALTPLGSTLRSDRPDSMRAFAIMMVDDYNWQSWGDFLQSVKTGQTAFDRVHGLKIFDYLGKHPDKAPARSRAGSSWPLATSSNPCRRAPMPTSYMLVGPGGRERTRGEFAQLFARAGLKLRRIIPTASPLSIVEGVSDSR